MKKLIQQAYRDQGLSYKPIILFFGLVLFVLHTAYAQDRTISGKVTSVEDGEGLPGVNILVKGSSQGTISDVEGNYTIKVNQENPVLVFSSIGYLSEEVEVGNQSEINLSLSPDIKSLQEVVVIGYGEQKKSDLTGAVGSVSSEEIDKFVTSNATQAIQGRVAGVRVESAGGAPGSPALVTIRGAGTLSDSGPLYVIDGMLTNSMSSLNPNDIESINVLKDASAAAIYGSRAANGVIIVTTKKGTNNGKVGIDVDLNYGLQEAANTLDWANARQYADIRNRANDNDGTPRSPANDAQFDSGIDSDIQAATLRTAPIFSGNFRIFGGGENTTYNVSANHLEQEGILEQSSFSRTNVRANSTFTLGRLKIEETIGLNRTVDNPNPYFNQERDILPTIPLRDEDGNFTATSQADGSTSIYGVGNITNSLALASLEDRTVTRNSVLGNIAASFEIVEGLTYKLNLGIDAYSNNNYKFTPQFRLNNTLLGRQDFAQLNETNTNFLSTLIENTLNYDRTFGPHALNLLAGYTEQKTNLRSLGIVATGFPSNDIRVASAAETRSQAPSQDITTGLLSYFGRINYVFDDKYLFTATLRRDGSSLFKEDQRWGVFPSVALGWNISNESFMESMTAIDFLKLRVSYGELGSNNIQAYATDPELNLFSEYILGDGGRRVQGTSITKGVNPNLKWETTKTTDIGLELGLMESRLQLTLDYFIKESEDILVSLSVPRYTGYTNNVPANVASITNKGFEFLASYVQTIGELTFNVSGNFTILDNEVTALGQDPIEGGGFSSNGLSATLTDIGQPVGSFYGYKVAGIYQTDQQAIEDGRTDGAGAGDFIFEDTNEDGSITTDDQVFLGSPIPTLEYGLNINAEYNNFDLTLFFNGVDGNKILNANRYRGYFDTEGNYLADALNAWTPENTNTNIPQNTLIDAGFNRRMSDFYLENGAYFRLRNVQLGYRLPSDLSSIGISNLRFYVSAQNLFTLTDYSGYYPEVGRGSRDRGSDQDIFNAGVDESAYPVPKTYQIGLQVSF